MGTTSWKPWHLFINETTAPLFWFGAFLVVFLGGSMLLVHTQAEFGPVRILKNGLDNVATSLHYWGLLFTRPFPFNGLVFWVVIWFALWIPLARLVGLSPGWATVLASFGCSALGSWVVPWFWTNFEMEPLPA